MNSIHRLPGSKILVPSLSEYPPVIDNIPEIYEAASFETFKEFDDSSKNVLRKCKVLMTNEENQKGFFLFGCVGSGKTHLAISIAKRMRPKYCYTDRFKEEEEETIVHKYRSVKILFLRSLKYFDEMIGFNKRIVMENIIKYDVIIFDDLALSNYNETKIESCFSLIDECYSKKKTLILTSNFNPEDFSMKDPRITSRLAQMCYFIKFDGQDYRFIQAQKEALLS